MTSTELFETYDATTQRIAVAKEELKTLYATLASVGKAARRNGADWQKAIAPYKEAIAEAEQTIAQLKSQADQEWLEAQLADSREIEEQMQAKQKSEQVTNDVTPEQMAALMPFAQEYSEHKQMERATFAVESALETVPMEQERQVVRVERRSEFSMCSTSWFYYHPECYSLQGTTPIEINELSHREVGSRAVCAECGESVHKAPEQVQRQEKQETDNQQQAYRHTFDQQRWFYYHKVCVEHNPPEVHFDLIPLGEVPQEAECDLCYRPVHGSSAYYATQEEKTKTKTKRKKGRPSQDKMIRHYTIDREVAEFIDSLPDGERSRFVNGLLKQGVENARRTNP